MSDKEKFIHSQTRKCVFKMCFQKAHLRDKWKMCAGDGWLENLDICLKVW